MKTFIQYMLESGICLGLFYFIFYFSLRKESFHNYLRSYILIAITASLLIPIVPTNLHPQFITNNNATFPILINKNNTPIQNNLVPKKPQNLETTTQSKEENIAVKESSFKITTQQIIYSAYILGLLFFLFKFTINLYRIISLIRKSPKQKLNRVWIIYTDKNTSFSFFNYIFIQKGLHPKEEEQIIAHEKIHIQQKHTFDILFLELLKLILWFNPFIWLFKKSLVAIHEYYTDERILNNTESPEEYKALLLQQSIGFCHTQLAHSFNSSILKTRLWMMSKPKSGKWALYKLLFALPIILLGLYAFSKPLNNEINRNQLAGIDSLLNYYIETNQFNGNVLVFHKDKLVFEKSHGYANLQTKEALNLHTPFLLGLMTESFTATAIIKLKEEGKLEYTNSLSQYFKDLPAFMGNITIQQLLNHTSGIPPTDDFFPVQSGTTNNKIIYDIIKKMDRLYFDPGTDFRYSSTGYILLAMIIEKISSQSYEEFITHTILEPTKMRETYFLKENNFLDRKRAIGFKTDNEIFDYPQFTFGNSGIVSTVSDIHKFETALFSGNIISDADLNFALTPTKLKNGKDVNFGLGFILFKNKSEKTVGHYSWYGGTKALLWRELDKKNSIIILTNNSWSGFMGMAHSISNIINKKSYKPFTKRKPLDVEKTTAQKIVGLYKLAGSEVPIEITNENNTTYIRYNNNDEADHLYATNSDTFFIKEYPVEILFTKNSMDSITGMTVIGEDKKKYIKVK